MHLYEKGKTEYSFSVSDTQKAEKIIHEWLEANNFKCKEQDGNIYYVMTDYTPMRSGNSYFEYHIENGQVKTLVYVGSPKRPIAVPVNPKKTVLLVEAYRDILIPLFAALNNENKSTERNIQMQPNDQDNQIQDTETAQNQNPQPTPDPATTNFDNFKQAADKKKETMAEISFWLSLAMLILSLFGISLSVILIIIDYYLAIQGLKTKKRGKAIAALVLSTVSIVILVVLIALTLAE